MGKLVRACGKRRRGISCQQGGRRLKRRLFNLTALLSLLATMSLWARSYWVSEYYVADQQAPFRCNFLIHLESSTAAATRIEVLELSPRVWAGKKFSVEAHGPGTHLDIRDVAPTTADRVELLELLRRLITGDRDVERQLERR